MAQQTIIAHFDNRSQAQQAVDAVRQAGITGTSIRLLPETEVATQQRTSSSASYDHAKDEGGFWTSLGDLALPDDDRYAYAEGMSRGGLTLSVMADDSQMGQVADLLERHGAVDMDEREASWKREGWTGYMAASTGTASGVQMASSGAALSGTGVADERIELVEEQIRVGKRQTTAGRVRVRVYTVERPVEEQVSLRSEHVTIERRPVDREVAPGEAVFQERTIEASEYGEEAVVSKTARVKEEIALHKDVETHTETVRDTVRSTEVEVEDDRVGQGRVAGTEAGIQRGTGKI